MEFRPLEVTVISANDLKDVNRFSKMDVYAVVSISGDYRSKQKTPVDKDCGSNPKWSYAMKFTIDEAAAQQNRLTLCFNVKSDRSLGDKDIGEVQVPIKELLDHNDGYGKDEKVVSYSVRLPNGKAKGTMNFSYKFGEKFTHNVAPPLAPAAVKHSNEPVMAYPPGHPGASSAYPPPGAYPAPPGVAAGKDQGAYHPYPPAAYPAAAGKDQGAYHPYPPPGAYPPPPPAYGGYPQTAAAPGYGYPGYPPQATAGYGHGYGYGQQPVQKPQKPKKGKGSKMGMGMGLGLGAGLLGGLLVGDMVSDVSEMAAYSDGLDDGLDFDF